METAKSIILKLKTGEIKSIETKLSFGKVDYRRHGRRDCPVIVEMELRHAGKNKIEFSARGFIYNHIKKSYYNSGQCLDDIYNFKYRNSRFSEIYTFWKLYRLNTMHAGTPEQEKAVSEFRESTKNPDFYQICEHLRALGLYTVPHPTTGEPYNYGHEWLYDAIPEEDLQRIVDIMTDSTAPEFVRCMFRRWRRTYSDICRSRGGIRQ